MFSHSNTPITLRTSLQTTSPTAMATVPGRSAWSDRDPGSGIHVGMECPQTNMPYDIHISHCTHTHYRSTASLLIGNTTLHLISDAGIGAMLQQYASNTLTTIPCCNMKGRPALYSHMSCKALVRGTESLRNTLQDTERISHRSMTWGVYSVTTPHPTTSPWSYHAVS